MNKIMEEKIIVGIISGFILVITASFLNSKNISKSQKVILFCLIIFPPAQWILGIIFLNTNKKSTNENENENISKKKGPEVYEKEKSISTKMESRQVNNNIIANEDKFKEKRELLQKSLKMNLISQIEFDYKMKKIENEKEKIENKIKESKVFEENKTMLEKLYEQGIITKEEFELKNENIKNNIKDKKLQEEKKEAVKEDNILFYSFIIFIIVCFIAIYFDYKK